MKKFMMVVCCLLTFGFVLAGCATVGGIENKNEELIYDGNAAINVNGFLYFGNAYADSSAFTDDGSYKTAARLSYLARLNSNIERNSKGMNYSPSNTEKVSEQVIAQDDQFMFVIKDYIYYLTPNRYKFVDEENKSSFHFEYSTVRSCKLNGDKEKEIFTAEGEVSQIEVLKYENNYYIVMLAGSNLYSIKLNNGNGESVLLAENVKTVAIPETYQAKINGSIKDWNGDIYFTVDREDGSGSVVNKIKLNETKDDAKSVYNVKNNTVSFLDRVGDMIFYSIATNSQTLVYFNNVSQATNGNDIIRTDNANDFYAGSSVSDVQVIRYGTAGETIIYKNASEVLSYKSSIGKGTFSFQTNSTDITDSTLLFINDRLAYISTATNIYKVDLASLATSNGNVTLEAIAMVTMTAIKTGNLFSFDGQHIYYYAQLEELTEEEQAAEDKEKEENKEENADEEEKAITEIDANYYLYRVAVNTSRTDKYELIGKTQTDKRHSN